MSNHTQAFQKFARILDRKQIQHKKDLDIRDYVLSFRYKRLGIGYVPETLQTKFGANLPTLFRNLTACNEKGIEASEAYLGSGTIFRDPLHSHKGLVQLLEKMPDEAPYLFFETGFLATTHSWAHSFNEGRPEYACLGYVFDDMAHYFMADYPNRIIQKLNSDEELTPEQQARAKGLIDRIVRQRISKYNAQPMRAPTMTEGYSRRVLVCDQAYADASTVYGKVDDAKFEQMLVAALQENPDAEVIVKTHPDSSWKKNERKGYYAHLTAAGRIRLLREPVNPFAIFDQVDKVYVGTSQMGLEALFAGKKVVCFGVPFYAGWGLTDDRQPTPHRSRTRSLEELFYYFYIWYTIYHVPGCAIPSEVEDVLDYIETNRPYQLPLTQDEIDAPPKVSVIIPVYGVEKYIEECLVSIQKQTLREIEIIPVNDCSPDGSQAIIERLAAEDPRIHPLILKENIGQGFARNRALDAARGEYIWFLDGDDWLGDPTFFEQVVSVADRNNADMTRAKKAGEAIFDASGNNLIRIQEDASEVFFTKNVEKTTYQDNQTILHSRHFCLWLYRRQFLDDNGIRFQTTQWEERAFLLSALFLAKTLSLTTAQSLMYRIRKDSTARRLKTLRDVDNFLANFESVAKLLSDYGSTCHSSPFRPHVNFHISQFIHYLFFGFWYETLLLNSKNTESYLERIAKTLEELRFQVEDFTASPINIRKELVESGTYDMIIATLRSRRFDLLALAVAQAPIKQRDFLAVQLAEPHYDTDTALQGALNRYARNEKVLTERQEGHSRLISGKMPRIVIHIGATKTGSTSIQSFFEMNRPAMMRQGVYYPERGLFWQESRAHKQAGHATFGREAVLEKSALRQHVESAVMLAEGQIHTIVLSSEAFFLNDKTVKLASHFSGYPVQIVVYLRRQDEWLNSQYAEFVAGGAVNRVDCPVEEWIKADITRERIDYLSKIKLWEAAVGRENTRIGVYDRNALKDGDIISDFLFLTGLGQLVCLPRPEKDKSNIFPYGSAHVELMRHFNKGPWKDRESYFAFINEVDQGVAQIRRQKNLSKPKLDLLDYAARQNILEQVKDGNAQIAREYFGRSDGTLFAPLSTNYKRVEELLTAEEIAFMISAFEKWRLKPASPAQKKTDKNASILTRTVHPSKSIRETFSFKVFSFLLRPFLWEAKKIKFQQQPDNFFADSKGKLLKLLYGVILYEQNLKADDGAKEILYDSALIRDTFVYRAFVRFGKKIGTRKFAKLVNKPDLFFLDISGFKGGV
ncbi:glycosyltransferase [Lamprobacter modestohalophilus]|uniref:capsular polysaccharide export protein, LipB/KpsS family n=1 Tax=Lamprobacter modestohalophilus TaxID=1064514 RepID=UPI002ADECE26|nr:glycosyltransferase [Lamprobacter modestohalophilus]MEA1052141.1 glycosyltransferase [Lamprobacter modestohalophilus]